MLAPINIRHFLMAIICVGTFCACSKKEDSTMPSTTTPNEYTCPVAYNKAMGWPILVGFTPQELDTVYLSWSSYGSVRAVDTFGHTRFSIRHDTATLCPYSQLPLFPA